MDALAAIETERLFIRPFVLSDAASYLPLVSDPQVIRYTADKPLKSAEEAASFLQAYPLRDYALFGYGRMACIEKATGDLIGFTGLKYLEDMDETDIGYRFVPSAWGKGYATESAAAVMERQPALLGLERVIGLVEPQNSGSVRVLTKLGMAYERRIADEAHGFLDIYARAFHG